QYRALTQARTASKIWTVADARRLAKKRVPRPVFDYIDGGAGAERTMKANIEAIAEVQFRPKMGVTRGVPGPDLSTSVLGTPVEVPILLSPVGFARMMDPLGDVAGARAAAAAGTIFTVSTMSGHAMGEVIAAAGGLAWFQLYFLGGRAGAERIITKACEA